MFGSDLRQDLTRGACEPPSRAQSQALLELVMRKLYGQCLQHELAERFSASTPALPQTAMDIFRNVFDLKVRRSMTIACPEHPGQIDTTLFWSRSLQLAGRMPNCQAPDSAPRIPFVPEHLPTTCR